MNGPGEAKSYSDYIPREIVTYWEIKNFSHT
jgi:hypothetical protein